MRVGTVLVVGAGPGGSAAAVALAGRGAQVTLVERSELAATQGQALTFGPVIHQALQELGILDDLVAAGHDFSGIAASRAIGAPVDSPAMQSAVPGVKPMLSLWRPALYRALTTRARALGVDIRVGIALEGLSQDADAVEATFSDGSRGRFDLVIGADGIRSRVREVVAAGTEVEPLPQSGYRAILDDVDIDDLDRSFLGVRPDSKVGFIPLADRHAYVTIAYNGVEPGGRLPERDVPRRMREILAAETGEMARLRDLVTDEVGLIPGRCSYRQMETVMVDGPWHRGRIVLVGDAAHGTSPNLGVGAGMAMEDVLVLVRVLDDDEPGDLEDALQRYSDQRRDRVLVVNRDSARLCRLEAEYGCDDPRVMTELMKAAAEFAATTSPTGPMPYAEVFTSPRE